MSTSEICSRSTCCGWRFLLIPSRAAAAVLFWTCLPYRSEWRYGRDAAKLCLLDAGHVCQNLYLAAEAIGCGVCGIGAYDQEAIDKLLGIDGSDEFVVYYSPVGKVR